MRLRCGECEVWREVTVTNKVAERFDIELDRRADLIHRALAQARPRAHGPAGRDDDRRAPPRPHRAGRLRAARLDLEPLVLQVELALDPVHDVVGDRALVAQPHDLGAAAPRAPRARSSGRRPSGPRSRRPRSCPRAPPAAACGTRTCRCMRSIVSSRVHSSPRSSSIRRERGLGGDEPRLELLALLLGAVVVHAEPADQRRQRQALQHERDEDHRERQEDQQVALREVARAARAPRRARPRRACPPSRRPCGSLPARAPRALGLAAVERADHEHERRGCQTSRVSTTAALTADRVAEPASTGRRSSAVEDRRQLQPDQHEQERVEQELRAAPTCRSPAGGSRARRSSAPASRRSSRR